MFEHYYNKVQNIEGWFRFNEARLFYETINKLKGNASMVEIGSWCGKSLIFTHLISTENNNNCKKYAIDPFLTSKNEPNGKYEIFIENLKKYNLLDKIVHIKEKSNDAGKKFKNDIEFLFIDGFHVYQCVKNDFELFSKHVVENGYILIHDVSAWFGPTQLIYDIAESATNMQILDFQDLTVLMQKVPVLNKEGIEKNRYFANIIKQKIEAKKIKLLR